jgi:predicted nucleic acid-binding protein
VSDPFDGERLLADTSAWSTIHKAPPELQASWSAALRERRIVLCPIVQFELTIAARNRAMIERLGEQFGALYSVPVRTPTVTAALRAIEELATLGGDGYHRVRLADALIAATASDGKYLPVLHYDKHFERLKKVLTFDSRPIAPFGSI